VLSDLNSGTLSLSFGPSFSGSSQGSAQGTLKVGEIANYIAYFIINQTAVDAGGRDSIALRSALLLAQKAIIPIGASNLDASALTDLLSIIDLAKDYNANLYVTVLLTRIDPRTKDTVEMLNFLSNEKLAVLHSKICERVAFRRAIGEGAIVHELDKDKSAINEIDAFFKEVTS
ncbi:MAG: hypothetical protein VWZ86_06480, partial [Flavobacteriaceae bacterium]